MGATCNDIYETLHRPSPEYSAKMRHAIPDAAVVEDRRLYILEKCKGKHVLNLGCASGSLHGLIREVASDVWGIDRNPPADHLSDLDSVAHLNGVYDLVVIGEVLEHLSNPGNLLQAVRELRCPVLITVPNALSRILQGHLEDGIENVNIDHVAYYSYWTLRRLVERYGFKVTDFKWYNGEPLTAEGLIFMVE